MARRTKREAELERLLAERDLEIRTLREDLQFWEEGALRQRAELARLRLLAKHGATLRELREALGVFRRAGRQPINARVVLDSYLRAETGRLSYREVCGSIDVDEYAALPVTTTPCTRPDGTPCDCGERVVRTEALRLAPACGPTPSKRERLEFAARYAPFASLTAAWDALSPIVRERQLGDVLPSRRQCQLWDRAGRPVRKSASEV